jgi:hypothetical protein
MQKQYLNQVLAIKHSVVYIWETLTVVGTGRALQMQANKVFRWKILGLGAQIYTFDFVVL